MTETPTIHGRLLARNTVWNLIGQVIPLLVGVVTIPYVIRGLGTAAFGILSIAWVVLGYLSLLDLGLGRATTKFVAECLARNEIRRLPGLLWTSIGFLVFLGAAIALVVVAIIPVLVERLLKIPALLMEETKVGFIVLAASLPVLLGTNALRGVLEGAQRFDLVNLIKVPSNVSVFLLPALGLAVGFRLPGIIVLLVLARLVSALGYLTCSIKVFPVLGGSFSFDPKMLRPLATYGGWLTVSNILGALLMNVERIFIGAMRSVADVGYYTAPFEVVARLWIFPSSLAATLFPAFSGMGISNAVKPELARVYARSVKSLLLALGPAMALVALFAHRILHFWLGPNFAEQSTLVMQILSVGVLVNSLAFVPFTLLQGIGRPDLTAKFHMVEMSLYVGLLWVLIGRMGIAGAALAWTLRITADAGLLFGACWWLRLVPFRAFAENGLVRSTLGVCSFVIALWLLGSTKAALATQVILAACMLTTFVISAWILMLDSTDRRILASAARQVLASFRRANGAR